MKLLKWIWPGLILLIWQIIYLLNIFPPLVFPSIIDIFGGIIKDTRSGELPTHLIYSILIILLAAIPSVIVSFLMTFLSIKNLVIEQITKKLCALLHPLPGIALLPLLIIWSGLGIHIVVLIVIHSTLWPLYINIRDGFKMIPQIWLDLGRNNNLSKVDEFLYILLPGAFPNIITGLKIAWARAWRAVISAEMIYGTIGNSGGLGWYIFNKRIFMDTSGLYGGILILMIIGLLVESLLFKKIEIKVIERWSK